MKRYWHIAHPAWMAGQPLRSRDALADEGINIPWLWDEAPDGTDCELVCLFPDTEQGRKEANWLADDRPGYIIIRVDLPDDFTITRAEWEDYPAVRNEIGGEFLTAVATIT